MGRLLLVINKILGSKLLALNRALALVDSSRLLTSTALVDSSRLPASQVLGSSHLPSSRILPGKHLVTSTTSVGRTLVSRPLVTSRASPLVDSKHLAINPALVSLVASSLSRVFLSNSNLAVRVNLPSLLHIRLILGQCKTSSSGKLLTSPGKEVICPPGRVPNTIKINHSLVKIRLLFPIIGSLVNSKAS